MSLKEEIDKSIKEAMLNKKKDELTALRSIKSLILLEETKEGATGSMNQDQEMAILKKAAKQRKDSIQIFVDQGREDLASTEKLELEVIERFLPEQMSEEEISQIVSKAIEEVGAQGMADFGKVMPVAIRLSAGAADNKVLADLIKKSLAG